MTPRGLCRLARMAYRQSMPGRMNFTLDVGSGPGKRAAAGGPGGPMRLLGMGDFTNPPAAERPPLANRPTHRVDLDNVDELIRRLAPRVVLPAGGGACSRHP